MEHGFNQAKYQIADDIDIIREAKLLVGSFSPLDFLDIRVVLDLDFRIDERITEDSQMCTIALATIKNRHSVNKYFYKQN